MTTSTITVVHCDFPGCDEQSPKPDGRTVPEGWTDGRYVHGCPRHWEAIAQHKPTIESETYKRKDWYSLRCACGWTPPRRAVWSSSGLRDQHLAHLADALAAEQSEGSDRRD